jgi:acetylglutamate kinase
MAPKLEAARAAALKGVETWIAAWNGAGTLKALLDGTGTGTRIARTEEVVHD